MEYVIVYLLTMSYCLAPTGKTACERQQDTYEFTVSNDCVRIRNDMVTLYDKYYGNVILYRDKSKCSAVVRPVKDVANIDDLSAAELIFSHHVFTYSTEQEAQENGDKYIGDAVESEGGYK